MRVIVPYTNLRPLVKAALEQYNLHPQFIRLDHEDSYWHLLSDIWERNEPVVINEHDVLPWPGAIQEIQNCPAHWCSYTYRMQGGYGIHHAFGCTKLGQGLIETLPDAWVNVDSTRWSDLDAQLCIMARNAGLTPHPHRPPVIHLKELPA